MSPEGETARALVVDDSEVVRLKLRRLIERSPDFEFAGEARDGETGVAMARQLRPDVVVMDLRMPVMDGQSATRAIRALERRDAPRVPIIAMTADAFEESIREAKQAGMNGYVTKPVESAKLYRTLAQLIYGA